MTAQPATPFVKDTGRSTRVAQTIRDYLGLFDASEGGDVEARKAGYAQLVSDYYDVVTDFYEYGWGDSFHFAPRFKGEPFKASLARHQHYLALRLGLGVGQTVLDVGCGVGGPMRSIARFSGARVEGINYSQYQVDKAETYNQKAGLGGQCDVHHGDFMAMPFEDGAYAAAFAIEATCHAPDRSVCFSEVHRVLRPGGLFAAYEWCLTDAYDGGSAHRAIKQDIESGNGLPELTPMSVVDDALRSAGFELIETADRAVTADPETPWHLPLRGDGLSLTTFRQSRAGRFVSKRMVRAMERLGVAPKGSSAVSEMLNVGADALVRAGDLRIFTPCYFFLARKAP